MKTTTDDGAGLAPMDCSGFSPHEIDCINAATFAVDHAEHCYLPKEDMDILQQLGIIEFCPPPEDDDEAEYGYIVTDYGEQLATRISNEDIIPNDKEEPRRK